MNMKKIRPARKSQSGFTLIELLVVVLIIGILAAIAVPQYFKVVEKGKVSEAMSMLDALRGAQERYLAVRGIYCAGDPSGNLNAAGACPGWDLPPLAAAGGNAMKYFNMNPMNVGNAPNWNISLVRIQNVSNYGQYAITYAVTPGAPPTFTCPAGNCQTDLMPQ